MRIAIVSTMGGVPWGGSEELWAEMAREAARDGNDVRAYLWRSSSPRPQANALAQSGVRVHEYTPPDSPASQRNHRLIVRHPGLTRPFRRLLFSFENLLRFKPDAVCLSLGDAYALGQHRAYHLLVDEMIKRAIPYVIVIQLAVDEWMPDASAAAISLRAFKAARHIGFVSQHNLELVQRQLAVTLPNAAVIRNPVNMADRSAVPYPADATARLACVARLQLVHKGQDLLLDALASPRWKQRDWSLRLYGTGPDEAKTREIIEKNSLQSRVEIVGHVDDVRKLWAANQLLVMPSRMEGTPLAMVEAMLCGRAGVCCPAGGIPEWIEEGRSGFLAQEMTVAAFSEALERAWQARDCWEEIGRSARARALELYDPQPGRTLLNQLLPSRASASVAFACPMCISASAKHS